MPFSNQNFGVIDCLNALGLTLSLNAGLGGALFSASTNIDINSLERIIKICAKSSTILGGAMSGVVIGASTGYGLANIVAKINPSINKDHLIKNLTFAGGAFGSIVGGVTGGMFKADSNADFAFEIAEIMADNVLGSLFLETTILGFVGMGCFNFGDCLLNFFSEAAEM